MRLDRLRLVRRAGPLLAQLEAAATDEETRRCVRKLRALLWSF